MVNNQCTLNWYGVWVRFIYLQFCFFFFFSLFSCALGSRFVAWAKVAFVVLEESTHRARAAHSLTSTRTPCLTHRPSATHRFHGLHGVFNVWCAPSTSTKRNIITCGAIVIVHNWKLQETFPNYRKSNDDWARQLRYVSWYIVVPLRCTLRTYWQRVYAWIFLVDGDADNRQSMCRHSIPLRWAAQINDHMVHTHTITWQVLITLLPGTFPSLGPSPVTFTHA